MRYVKWIGVILSIMWFSFVDKDSIFSGYGVGDKAPLFTLSTTNEEGHTLALSELKGEYVLLSFWASYDADSRMKNVQLSKAIANVPEANIKMISISFDEFRSVYSETIKMDQIDPTMSFVETKGEKSSLYKQYRLKKGFRNYLLNPEGIIIAKDVNPHDIVEYL